MKKIMKWAILCLGWHRDVRRNSPDMFGPILMGGSPFPAAKTSSVAMKQSRLCINKSDNCITTSNLARFLAWGLPAFQTAAVIVARLVDADELLGSCFVGNQSDKGLQILVATPLFCYWIFGSMNLASGFLVYRRNRDILRNTNLPSIRMMLQTSRSISGSFLFIYCLPSALLLLVIIYEFANIDVWLNFSPYIASIKTSTMLSSETPMWPFVTRAFMELMLAIICSAWILVPKISSIYKKKFAKTAIKTQPESIQSQPVSLAASANNSCCKKSNKKISMGSYQSVRQPKNVQVLMKHQQNSAMIMKTTSSYSKGRNKASNTYSAHNYMSSVCKNGIQSFHHYEDETIL